MLNKYEQIKLDTISKLVSKEIKIKEAMELLNLTERQIYRLKKIFKENGENGFIHKNRGKSSPRKIDSLIIEQIKDLYLSEYYDFNFEHFYEDVICGQFDISYNTMLKAFIDDDIISPLAHKKTVQKYKEKMESLIKEKNINEEINDKIKLIKSRIIETEKAHTRRSSNLYVFGQEVQMDACEKYWFGGIVSYLHLAVDKATKKVLFGWFEYEEITRGYYVLLFHIIINYGIPDKIKADNKSTFSANNAKDKSKKNFMTQFGKVCERLNITLYTTSSSTAKANVERENEHVLLTLLWRKSKLLLAFKLKHKTSDYVTEVFEKIKQKLGMELFHRYFPIILTDNGSEFSNPYDIENNGPDVIDSKVFYCDPRASQQKGSIEVAHEYIRRFISKGISLNDYTQNDINLMINHINNTPRKSLDDKLSNNTPFYLQKTITEDIFFNTFKLYYIKPTEVILNKTIFKINKGDAK